MRALVGGLYQEDLSGINQARKEKTGVQLLPRGPWSHVLTMPVRWPLGVFPPVTPPPVTHCFGKDSSGEAGVENLDSKHALLALCRMHSWGRPQLGKDNLNCNRLNCTVRLDEIFKFLQWDCYSFWKESEKLWELLAISARGRKDQLCRTWLERVRERREVLWIITQLCPTSSVNWWSHFCHWIG